LGEDERWVLSYNLSSHKMLLNCLAKLGNDSAVQLVVDDMIRVSQILKNDVCCKDFLAIKLKIIIV
jgi:hypothetical protein